MVEDGKRRAIFARRSNVGGHSHTKEEGAGVFFLHNPLIRHQVDLALGWRLGGMGHCSIEGHGSGQQGARSTNANPS